MKKIFLIALIIFLILTLTSCNLNISDKTKQISNDKSKEIIRCFDEKDIDGLKNMFCNEIINSHDLDTEIQRAFNMYSGTSVSYNLFYGGNAGTWDHGTCVDEHITPQIRDLKTSNDKMYRIVRHEYLIYKENENCIGITYMRIFDESTDEMIEIGDYVY